MRRFAVILCVLLLAACMDRGDAVYIAPGYTYTLQSPAAAAPFSVLQDIVMQTPAGREERLLVQIENDAKSLRLAALTPLGQTLLTLEFDGTRVKTTSALPSAPAFDARFVVALLQLAQWPLEVARKGLGPDLTLDERGGTREVRARDKVLWTLVREGDAAPYRTVHIHSDEVRLALHITTLQE